MNFSIILGIFNDFDTSKSTSRKANFDLYELCSLSCAYAFELLSYSNCVVVSRLNLHFLLIFSD